MSSPSTPQRSFWVRPLACLICLLAINLFAVQSAEPPSGRLPISLSPPPPANESRQLPLETGVALGTADTQHASVSDPRLIGFWEYHGPRGVITLEFISENRLVFAGRPLQYKLTADTLSVVDGSDEVDYVYHVDGNRLELDVPGPGRHLHHLAFHRVSTSAPGSEAR